MNNELYSFVSKQKYLSDIPFIFERNIFEFDIKQANIHALLAAKVLTQNEFDYLSKLPKDLREIDIGNRIKANAEIYNQIQNKICLAKYYFCEQNNIQESQVLRIANDSLYLVLPYNDINPVVSVDGVQFTFVLKNHFTNYMMLNKNVLFFCDTSGDYWNIDVKGIGQDKLSLHNEFLSCICNILDARNNGGKEVAITEFNKLYNDYITYSLPIKTYRELNSSSMYKIKNIANNDYYVSDLGLFTDNKNLDITYNLDILRTIYSYLMQS